MKYRDIKTLKDEVEYCLQNDVDCRNSDIVLMQKIYRIFYKEHLIGNESVGYALPLGKFHKVPAHGSIKRCRASFQSTKDGEVGEYLPTNEKVARNRGININEWRVAMGYPTKETVGDEVPSWVPPSEKSKNKLV